MKAVLAIVAAAGLAGCVAYNPYGYYVPYTYYPQANSADGTAVANPGVLYAYPGYAAYPYTYAYPYPYYYPDYPLALAWGVGLGYWWGGYNHGGQHWHGGNGRGRPTWGGGRGGGGRRR